MAVTKQASETKKMQEKKEERERMTVYISKSIAKKFKIHAIETDKDFSQLAEIAFIQLLEEQKQKTS